MISGAFERPCSFLACHEQFPALLDTSSSRYLYLLTMVGWKNRHKEAQSSTTAEKQFLIKLNSDGDLIWHTFMGSPGVIDEGWGIALDGSGNVYVTGLSYATWG